MVLKVLEVFGRELGLGACMLRLHWIVPGSKRIVLRYLLFGCCDPRQANSSRSRPFPFGMLVPRRNVSGSDDCREVERAKARPRRRHGHHGP
jgi:hypothetical protein